MKTRRLQVTIISILAIFLISVATTNAATWTVTKFTNSNDNVCNSDCSLREAVFNADSGDTVVFDPNLFGQQFTLGGSEIVITRRITIDGQLNPSVAHISGENTSRIFLIETGGGLELKNAVIVSGNGVSAIHLSGFGGAIHAKAGSMLSLVRVAVRNNTSNSAGSFYAREANVHLVNTSFTTNSATLCAAFTLDESNANIANVTISDNFDNDLNDGADAGAVCLRNSNTTIRNSTITNNFVYRSGMFIQETFPAANSTLNIGNTIVAQNNVVFGGDVDDNFSNSTIISVGGNLIGTTFQIPVGTFTQPNDITGVNPLLAPTNSGQGGFPVVSHPLQAGSPARNGGLNANAFDPLTNAPLTTDTRGTGFPRITDTTVDIGAFEDQSGNTSLIVSKNANSNDLVCDTDCSLREAVYQASLNFGTDTITFAHNAFGIIPLGGSEIVIQNQNVNIIGTPSPNANYRIISGENTNRIFRLNNATANISGLSLANGNAGAGFGGAILAENNSNLTLDKVIVRNNFAVAYGAAHLSGGTHRIINTTINNNSANTGLAISVSGTLNMANTTVSGNLDADGGTGIGAIYVTGTANIRNSTIAFNRTSGGTGGGIFVAGTLNIGNSIVANNIAAVSPDIERSSGVITSVGGNLVQNTNGFPAGTFSQANDAVNLDPMLAALADNGGNVTTHSLLPNSQAQNTG
ncbi:MAG: choice-of-anchor Q domain-containing protein, partial [Pyrinomonadaceae bacterium]